LFIIDVPLTCRANTSLFEGTRFEGRAKYSSGLSIASIGLPAVI